MAEDTTIEIPPPKPQGWVKGMVSKISSFAKNVPKQVLLLQKSANKAIESLLRKAWTNQRQLRILVTGKTGQAKSTLINGILGAEVAIEGARAKRCTTEVAEFAKVIHGVPIKVFDSPGLQDRTQNEEEYIQGMRDKCKELSLVLYCTKMVNTRLTDDDKHAMKKLTKAFGEGFWNYAVFVLTFANMENCSRKDDRDKDVEEPDFDDKEGWKELIKQRFKSRLELWEKELKQFLIEEVGVSQKIAERIPVVPTGDYKPSYENRKPLCLPDRDSWFMSFWEACCLRVKETRLFLQVNQDRMVADDNDDNDDGDADEGIETSEDEKEQGKLEDEKEEGKLGDEKEVGKLEDEKEEGKLGDEKEEAKVGLKEQEVISKDKVKAKYDDEKSIEKEMEAIGKYTAAMRQHWKEFEEKHQKQPKIPSPVPKRVSRNKSVSEFPQRDEEVSKSKQLKRQPKSDSNLINSPTPLLKEEPIQDDSVSQDTGPALSSSPPKLMKPDSTHSVKDMKKEPGAESTTCQASSGSSTTALPKHDVKATCSHPVNYNVHITNTFVKEVTVESVRRKFGESVADAIKAAFDSVIAKPTKWLVRVSKKK